MAFYLKFAGAIALLLVAGFVSRSYADCVSRRITETRSFCALISHIKGMVEKYLSPGRAVLKDYRDTTLEKLGFFERVESGEGLYDAFMSVRERLSLGSEAKKLVSDFFRGFGKEYQRGEVLRAEKYERELLEILNLETEEFGKKQKAVTTLLFASAFGIIILIL